MNYTRYCTHCGKHRPVRRGCVNDYQRNGGTNYTRRGTGLFVCHTCAAKPITAPKTLRFRPDSEGVLRLVGGA